MRSHCHQHDDLIPQLADQMVIAVDAHLPVLRQALEALQAKRRVRPVGGERADRFRCPLLNVHGQFLPHPFELVEPDDLH
ncbi:MAG: hypothetical protein FJY65_05860 [Calditrichaeota bacterium]|nr:hypothetical protein [Calditrichota bacterium]